MWAWRLVRRWESWSSELRHNRAWTGPRTKSPGVGKEPVVALVVGRERRQAVVPGRDGVATAAMTVVADTCLARRALRLTRGKLPIFSINWAQNLLRGPRTKRTCVSLRQDDPMSTSMAPQNARKLGEDMVANLDGKNVNRRFASSIHTRNRAAASAPIYMRRVMHIQRDAIGRVA